MFLNTVLLAGTLAGAAALPQDPSFDLQIATPTQHHAEPIPATVQSVVVQGQATGGSTPFPTVPAQRVGSEPRVSVQFREAKTGEVLAWLEQQGVNFIAAESDVPRETRVTLNIKDQPLETVLNALGRALGGRWEREGAIRVFRKGPSFFVSPPAIQNLPPAVGLVPQIPEELAERVREQVRSSLRQNRELLRQSEKERGRTNTLRTTPRPFTFDRDVYRLAPAPRGTGIDVQRLLRSLTPDQRDTQRKRGFVPYEDLTREQRTLLGERPDGRFEFKFKTNRDEIVIRGQ